MAQEINLKTNITPVLSRQHIRPVYGQLRRPRAGDTVILPAAVRAGPWLAGASSRSHREPAGVEPARPGRGQPYLGDRIPGKAGGVQDHELARAAAEAADDRHHPAVPLLRLSRA